MASSSSCRTDGSIQRTHQQNRFRPTHLWSLQQSGYKAEKVQQLRSNLLLLHGMLGSGLVATRPTMCRMVWMWLLQEEGRSAPSLFWLQHRPLLFDGMPTSTLAVTQSGMRSE